MPVPIAAALNEVQRQTQHWAAEQVRERAKLQSQSAALNDHNTALQAQLDQMHAKLSLAHEDIASLQLERNETQRQHETLLQERAKALAAVQSLRESERAAREQIAAIAAAHQQAQAAHEQAQAAHQQEIDARRAAQEAHAREQQERHAERGALRAMADRNRVLRERLLEVYSQLHARDLPSLILQVAINLTDSECGLFVEADGDDTLAQVGLTELPDFIREALYDWTRRVAHEGEPVRENESSELPDGSRLVNLAALPVALHSELNGVILVANKRGEDGQPRPYDEEDTELLVAIGRHASLALENRRLNNELGESFQSTVAVLADAIEAKDAYTRGHCESVSDLAVQVAERLGFEGDDLRQIRYAALLHDVGKIGVPDGILLKPGSLLPEEFSIIKRHAQIGRDLVARVPSLLHIAPIVMHHHERIDGSGYPDGQSGEDISLASRIICVVDAFDAMTTPRPYRDPVSITDAIAELKRCAGTHFDPIVVDAVAQVLEERA